ncbi:MAG: translation initiation factor IF-3 [Candidatus Dormibacteria bacterium]
MLCSRAGIHAGRHDTPRRFQPIAFRELRINDQIRIPSVRLFDDETNEALGIVPVEQARRMAEERELDLVEVAPLAQPPVCRLMDYGRFKFEAIKKEHQSKREHSNINVKEMKLRPKISEHDFQTKFGYVKQFLRDGDKVKLTIMFRGREMVHQEYGRKLLDRMAEELKDFAIIERNPLVEGRTMIMIMRTLAKKQTKTDHHPSDSHRAARARHPVATGAAVQPVAEPADGEQRNPEKDAQDTNS